MTLKPITSSEEWEAASQFVGHIRLLLNIGDRPSIAFIGISYQAGWFTLRRLPFRFAFAMNRMISAATTIMRNGA
jgi:hypothetical protein